MPRIARMLVKGEPAVYHVMTRTALDGYVLGDVEKDHLFKLIQKLSSIYFTELLGYCIMGNHFHLLVRMNQEENYSDEEIIHRFQLYYGEGLKIDPTKGQLPALRAKWENLSEYIKEIKQQFSRFYNKRHNRRGFFWAERFKSIIVDNGETLINCLAYIDLNPVRAGLVERPEDYRWCSLGYHLQTNNKNDLLSLDFGLREFGMKGAAQRLAHYRAYVHHKGGIGTLDNNKPLPVNQKDRFRYRCRYFIDGGVIGSKEFVDRIYGQFKDIFYSANEKKPQQINGMTSIYSLKRLME
ncbi:MAG: transposase [Desulfobulbaceae bacterium]|nr:transposase [Desulfobulbaceae bacterium]